MFALMFVHYLIVSCSFKYPTRVSLLVERLNACQSQNVTKQIFDLSRWGGTILGKVPKVLVKMKSAPPLPEKMNPKSNNEYSIPINGNIMTIFKIDNTFFTSRTRIRFQKRVTRWLQIILINIS